MVDTTLPTRRAVADIVFAYRQLQGAPGRPCSLREFAASLSAALGPLHDGFSHQAIKNWEDRHNLPHRSAIRLLHRAGRGWVRDFAADLLAALEPENFAPVTEIGRRALERSLTDTGPHKPRYDRRYIAGRPE
jgi:hypothetical protein